MTRPRAADDFPMTRARMEELRRERSRPRATDDFAMIRARMEELRRVAAARILAEPVSTGVPSWVAALAGPERLSCLKRCQPPSRRCKRAST